MVEDLVEHIHQTLREGYDVDQALALFAELGRVAGPSDASVLVAAMGRADADFFTREMFGQIVCGFDRPDLLEPLLIAFDQNARDGHDNDGLAAELARLVEASPEASTAALRQLREGGHPGIAADTIDWLLEFCSDQPSS